MFEGRTFSLERGFHMKAFASVEIIGGSLVYVNGQHVATIHAPAPYDAGWMLSWKYGPDRLHDSRDDAIMQVLTQAWDYPVHGYIKPRSAGMVANNLDQLAPDLRSWMRVLPGSVQIPRTNATNLATVAKRWGWTEAEMRAWLLPTTGPQHRDAWVDVMEKARPEWMNA